MDFAFDYVDNLPHEPAGQGRLLKGAAFAKADGTRPPILLVHGAYHGAWCYALWMRELDRHGWPVAALDVRGHGGLPQDANFADAGVRQMAEDIVAAGDLIETPPILCGHSLGALLVGVAAETMDLAGLVLLAPSPPGQLPGARALPAIAEGKVKSPPDLSTASANFFPRWAGDPAAVAKLVGRLTPESPVLQNERFRLSVPVDRDAIDAPALCIACGLDSEDLHPPGQDKAVADFYDAEYRILPNASHCLMVDPDWQTGLNSILDWAQRRTGAHEIDR